MSTWHPFKKGDFVIKSILVVLPNNEDATSFYRGMGPISAMRRTRDMNLMFTNKASWPAVKASDVVFIQRPHDPSHLTLAETTKENNRPLWIDFDDLLFDIPNDNPAHNDYMRKETRLRIIEIIKMADVVTVSTPQLKKCLQVKGGVLNNNVHVVPNALDDDLLIHAKPFNLKKLVSWRGSPTHLNDCLVNGNGITAFAKEHKDWAFAFFGTNPWPITNCIEQNRALIVPPLTVDKYFKMGSTMNASVMMVPLADNLFNRCKSNIAWIEATLFGGVAVGPNWEEWDRPGVIRYGYQPGDTIFEALDRCASKPELLAEYHKLAMDYIRQNLMLSNVNKKRFHIMNALLSGKPIEGGEPYENLRPTRT